jgi:HK97 family phage prohead protease
MPTPNEGESRDDFVSRCIPIVLEDGTAEDQDQAVAVCNSMWEEAQAKVNWTRAEVLGGSNMEKQMERKTFHGFVTKADEEQGIVEAYFAVFGNIDQGNDVIHPGAFTKTFLERGGKVRVLDNHRTDTIERAIGKPLLLKEVGRDELPAELLAQNPEATGGAFARVQMLMDTPEGKGAFIRLRDGAIDEWSFGYDALDHDFSRAMKDGEEVNVRNLRTLKLYEISPVLFAMNEATTTVSAKDLMTPEMVADVIVDIPGFIAAEVEKGVSVATNLPLADRDRVPPEDKAQHRPVENKAINLSERVPDVMRAFYTEFPDVHNRNHGLHVVYWVKQVWDEFVIVEQEGTLGRRLWKIDYNVGENSEINFVPQPEWLEVTIAFVPIAPVTVVNDTMQVASDNQNDEQAGPDVPPTSNVLDELEMLKLQTETLEVSYEHEEQGVART